MLHDKLVTKNELVTMKGKGHGDFSKEEWDYVRSRVLNFMNNNN